MTPSSQEIVVAETLVVTTLAQNDDTTHLGSRREEEEEESSDCNKSEGYTGSPRPKLILMQRINSIFINFDDILDLGSYETIVSFLEITANRYTEEYNGINDISQKIPIGRDKSRIEAAKIITGAMDLFASTTYIQGITGKSSDRINRIEEKFWKTHKNQKGITNDMSTSEMQRAMQTYLKNEWKALGRGWLNHLKPVSLD
ncbi:hypothetical protein EYR41_006102 [Orbilia oligospora]|uniref:Uncharacterized protein n=1 Tax=Orbilia oligospora TaxID=2813651 RepID=A0A8H2E0F8_ORBOL|nr:hypothetical protein EYR41_006102 [Orbilia oligospora]